MSIADDISDVALVRVFNEARTRMDLPAALRAVIDEAERIKRDTDRLTKQFLPLSVWPVVDEIARRNFTTRGAMLAHGDRSLTRARNLCWWILHWRFGLSFPLIGKIFDGRDHSTIVRMTNDFQRRMGDDGRAEVDAIVAAVYAQLAVKAA